MAKKRLTPAQKKALDHYCFCERQEDRYMGSVFVNGPGERQHRERTHNAYLECVRLGLDETTGL